MPTTVLNMSRPLGHSELLQRYVQIRDFSRRLAAPLTPEDCGIQSMADASPTRWHLAHTTWFFETFVLKSSAGYRPLDARYEAMFNSYYNTVGQQFPRERRGQISRPGLTETLDYRAYVDRCMMDCFSAEAFSESQLACIELGLNHEQQHQELILTDIKHVLFGNPLFPAYGLPADENTATRCGDDVLRPLDWSSSAGGIVDIGWDRIDGFAFDNESPRHQALIPPFRIATRCVTNGEYMEFIDDSGYQRSEFWLSMGWNQVQLAGWEGPLYWIRQDGQWLQFTLAGLLPLDPAEPVCHVSYFEADAFARWAGKRLPTEFEWESEAVKSLQANPLIRGSPVRFADQILACQNTLHPQVERVGDSPTMLGNVWQWTSSQYGAYPGYQAAAGALGEYNGKFMCNQFVLRGGSCATSSSHIRAAYRNFFPPEARWQFSGLRLAW